MPPEETTSPDSGGEKEGVEVATPPLSAGDQPAADHVMSGTEDHETEAGGASLEVKLEKAPQTTVVDFDRVTKPTESGNDPKVGIVTEMDVDDNTKAIHQNLENNSSSPTIDSTTVGPPPSKGHSVKDDKDLACLTELISQVTPEVAQKALRDNWRTFLFKPNDKNEPPHHHHLSFLIRAAIKNAPSSVIERVVKTGDFFRPELVQAARYVLPNSNIGWSMQCLPFSLENFPIESLLTLKSSMKASVVDRVLASVTAGKISAHVPEETLERVIFERLKYMKAPKIVNMLAKAHRLGYTKDDFVDAYENVHPYLPDQEDKDISDNNPITAHRSSLVPMQGTFLRHSLALPDTDPLLAEQERNAAELRNNVLSKTMKLPKAPRALKGGSFLPPRKYTHSSSIPTISMPTNISEAPRPPTGALKCPLCDVLIKNYSGYLHVRPHKIYLN